MKKHEFPTVTQANSTYLILIIIILIGSALLQRILGIGGNTWVNEIVYILLPAVILSKTNGWNFKKMYRYNKTSGTNILMGILSGAGMWFFSAYICVAVTTILNTKVGKLNVDLNQYSGNYVQIILLVIATVVLAPICEETLFRGFMLRAYDGFSEKYSFVIVGLIFGIFHVVNGVSNVFSASILGIMLGYLVYSTNSIFTSMSAHSANNLCAIIFSSLINTQDFSKLPMWFHITAFAGLLSALMILYIIRKNKRNVDEEDEMRHETIERHPIRNVLLLTASILILILIGVIEIFIRLKFLTI